MIQPITSLQSNVKLNYTDKNSEPKVFTQTTQYEAVYDGSGAQAIKSYTLASSNMNKNVNRSAKINLNLTDKQVEPTLNIEISTPKRVQTKQGLYPIYEMALNDQMADELAKNKNLQERGSYINPTSRKINIQCPQSEFADNLEMINKKFINLELDKDYVNQAKELAPILYFLHTRTGENAEYFEDIPKGMTEDEYAEIVNQISYDDVKKYNNEILANSEIKVELTINKDFYNENKNWIMKNLNGKI